MLKIGHFLLLLRTAELLHFFRTRVYFIEVAVIDIQARHHLAQAQRINEEENETRAQSQGHNRSKARIQEAAPGELRRLLATSNATTRSTHIRTPNRPTRHAEATWRSISKEATIGGSDTRNAT
jgi:hypothetical protein